MERSFESVGKDWGWVLALGVALIFIGIVTFNWPVHSTIGLTIGLGFLLVATGIVLGVHAIQQRHESGNGWRVIQSLAALAAGILMLRYPGVGMEGVAIAMCSYFFISAFAKGSVALSMRPVKGWGWVFASAVASGILGIYILMTLPLAALWVPGFIFGIDLIMYGASMVGISFDLKHIQRSVGGIHSDLAAHPR